jgi:hypothetical protein
MQHNKCSKLCRWPLVACTVGKNLTKPLCWKSRRRSWWPHRRKMVAEGMKSGPKPRPSGILGGFIPRCQTRFQPFSASCCKRHSPGESWVRPWEASSRQKAAAVLYGDGLLVLSGSCSGIRASGHTLRWLREPAAAGDAVTVTIPRAPAGQPVQQTPIGLRMGLVRKPRSFQLTLHWAGGPGSMLLSGCCD